MEVMTLASKVADHGIAGSYGSQCLKVIYDRNRTSHIPVRNSPFSVSSVATIFN